MLIRSFAIATPAIVLAAVAFGQPAESAAKFEIADVHASPPGAKSGSLSFSAGRFEVHGVTALRLIGFAYGVAEDRVFGGPNWLGDDRFEVIARADPSTPRSAIAVLVRALLAERFRLAAHTDEKPEPIYALVPGKRLQVKPNASPGNAQCKRIDGDGYYGAACQNVTMEILADLLPGMAPNYFNHPVVNKTGIEGTYDLTLRWSGRGQIGGGDPDHPSISLFDYLEKQVGIRVEAQTRLAPALVIEHLERVPTPNTPDTAGKLAPVATEFDAAEVRASKPDIEPVIKVQNGRLELLGQTLKRLIGFAFDVDDNSITSPEKWLDNDRFDVIAKAPANSSDGELRMMLSALLTQRFHLAIHREEKPATVFALTVMKGGPKFKSSATDTGTGCVRSPQDGLLVYTCRNSTMAQLAEKLPNVPGAWGYLNEYRMVDLTGLKGGYDFEFRWSPPDRFDKNASGAASAPAGGLTLFEAFEKQLGLKLAAERHPMPFLVIDRADRTPSEPR